MEAAFEVFFAQNSLAADIDINEEKGQNENDTVDESDEKIRG